ncbi:PREDICTED: ATP-dependent 6-phosphofructokinase, platelet type-like [Cercocebus atys]|uniref:ATP-dependent 6-phosphofructokinase, platelet type-like n=1 Tax=Cercocebus atys TaxID=9531 RepID=UPI0005F43492|nr:PREDICTED: ATP-dependent 6-phosphofructokinase, platelet type-like [Cercocebus atys]
MRAAHRALRSAFIAADMLSLPGGGSPRPEPLTEKIKTTIQRSLVLRNFGTKISARATEWITAKLKEAQGRGKTLTTDDSVCVLGISKRNVIFQPVAELKNQMDFEHRIPKERWWLKLRPLMKILAKYKASYNVSDSGRLEHMQP